MTAPSDPGGLQFDKVVGAAPAGAMNCVKCGKPIVGTYYELREKALCESCAAEINAQIAAHFARGRSGAAFARAAILGVGAAAAGALLYFLFVIATKSEWALVTLVIGYMVGWSIQRAAKGVGGRQYQVLAVVLTYLSVGAAYVMIDMRRGLELSAIGMIVGAIVAPVGQVLGNGVWGILNLIIIGVGLRQAWHMTAGARVLLKGPFRVGSAPSAATR